MMEFGNPLFVFLIVALSIVGWLVNNWIRAKHGYPLENEWGGTTAPCDNTESKALRQENAELRQTLGRMELRMRSLERIVTDKGYLVAEEIEALRHTPLPEPQDNGVPLRTEQKERI